MAEKLEIVVAAKDQASAVLKGVAGNLKGEIKSIEGASRSLGAAGNQMAGSTVAGFGQMKGSVKGFTGELGMAKLALAGLAVGATALVGKFIGAAAEAEKVSIKLGVAIRAAGQGVNQSNLEKLAEQLQNVTTYDDEAIKGAMALLGAHKLNETQIKRLTPALLDLSEFMGKDLAGAANVVGYALETKSNKGFARLKIALDESKLAMDPIGAIMEAITNACGGMAEAAGKGAAGQLAIFKNKVEDLEESLGTLLLPTLKLVVPLMTRLADAAKALAEVPGLGTVVSATMLGIGGLAMYGTVGPALGRGLGAAAKAVTWAGRATGLLRAAAPVAAPALVTGTALAAPALYPGAATALSALSPAAVAVESAAVSATATAAANVGVRIGVMTALKTLAGRAIGGVATGASASLPAAAAALPPAAFFLGAAKGSRDVERAMAGTEKALATPGVFVDRKTGVLDPTRTDPAYKKFMAMWKARRIATYQMSPLGLSDEEKAAIKAYDPHIAAMISGAENQELVAKLPVAVAPPTKAQLELDKKLFPPGMTEEQITAWSGWKPITKPVQKWKNGELVTEDEFTGAFSVPRVPGSRRPAAGRPAPVSVSNRAGRSVSVTRDPNGDLVFRVSLTPESLDRARGAIEDIQSEYLADLSYGEVY